MKYTKSCHGVPLAADRLAIVNAAAAGNRYTVVPNHDGVLLYLTLFRLRADLRPAGDRSNLDAHHDRASAVAAHAVEFSKTAKPL